MGATTQPVDRQADEVRRVLVVDDSNGYAESVCDDLSAEFKFDISYVLDPFEARERLQAETFDAVVADLLFGQVREAYEARRSNGNVSLQRDDTFYITGLTVLRDAAEFGRRPTCDPNSPRMAPAPIVWTIGEYVRYLHLAFAQQELGVNVYCSKGSNFQVKGRSGVRDLGVAIQEAVAGRPFHDAGIVAHLPRKGIPAIGATFFAESRWRDIWCAMALGHTEYDDIAREIFAAKPTIRNTVGAMRDRLVQFEPGQNSKRKSKELLSSYAEHNWEFFLDDAVMRTYPPKVADGLKGGN